LNIIALYFCKLTIILWNIQSEYSLILSYFAFNVISMEMAKFTTIITNIEAGFLRLVITLNASLDSCSSSKREFERVS